MVEETIWDYSTVGVGPVSRYKDRKRRRAGALRYRGQREDGDVPTRSG